MGQRAENNCEDIAESSVVTWLAEASPYIHSIMVAASTATRASSTGIEEESALDGIRSAALALQQWTIANPCSDAPLGDRFELLVARCGFLVLAAETDSKAEDVASSSATLDRLETLNANLREILADLQGF